MRRQPDRVDIPGIVAGRVQPDPQPGPCEPRPWLGVLFNCCHVYGRIHRNHDRTMYVGWCPRCGVRVQAKIGTGGTQRRIFETT